MNADLTSQSEKQEVKETLGCQSMIQYDGDNRPMQVIDDSCESVVEDGLSHSSKEVVTEQRIPRPLLSQPAEEDCYQITGYVGGDNDSQVADPEEPSFKIQ